MRCVKCFAAFLKCTLTVVALVALSVVVRLLLLSVGEYIARFFYRGL